MEAFSQTQIDLGQTSDPAIRICSNKCFVASAFLLLNLFRRLLALALRITPFFIPGFSILSPFVHNESHRLQPPPTVTSTIPFKLSQLQTALLQGPSLCMPGALLSPFPPPASSPLLLFGSHSLGSLHLVRTFSAAYFCP